MLKTLCLYAENSLKKTIFSLSGNAPVLTISNFVASFETKLTIKPVVE